MNDERWTLNDEGQRKRGRRRNNNNKRQNQDSTINWNCVLLWVVCSVCLALWVKAASFNQVFELPLYSKIAAGGTVHEYLNYDISSVSPSLSLLLNVFSCFLVLFFRHSVMNSQTKLSTKEKDETEAKESKAWLLACLDSRFLILDVNTRGLFSPASL